MSQLDALLEFKMKEAELIKELGPKLERNEALALPDNHQIFDGLPDGECLRINDCFVVRQKDWITLMFLIAEKKGCRKQLEAEIKNRSN